MTTTKTGADNVRATVQRLILENLNPDPGQIIDSAKLIEDLDADSFDMIELTIAAEDEFGIEINDAEAESLKTVGDVIALVEGKMAVPA